MNIKEQKKGISLIVLVITIIVMIILAAAIILSLDGSDIIGRAKEAQSASDLATAKEIVALAKSEWAYEKVDGYDTVIEYAESKLKEAGYKTDGNGGIELSNTGAINTIYIGSDKRQAIIPEGFTVSAVATEDTVTEGLVIIDKDGNEFVWVPVDDFAKFARTTTYNGTITDPGTDYTEPFSKTTSEGITLSLSNDLTREYAEYASMRASVEENKGFYIGRYEAGTVAERTDIANGTTELVVQKNKPVYNWVVWGSSMTDVIGDVTYLSKNHGKGAVELSRNMYKSSPSVVSTLCYGVEWDAALQFIATKDANYLTNSTEKGYYCYNEDWNHIEGMEEKAQPTGYYAVNNIYDMAGNVGEWTIEAYSTVGRVVRGGNYYGNGASNPASYHFGGIIPNVSGANCGFRLTLYIK